MSKISEMTLQKVLTKYGVKPATLHHCSLSEGKTAALNYDIVFCARNFAKMFDDAAKKGTTVIGLKNIMSAPEMEQAMKDAGLFD